MAKWSLDKARACYQVAGWSDGYVQINAAGEVIILPDGQRGLALPEIVQRLQQEGVKLPVLLRFSDILQDRVQRLNQAFASAMQAHQYAAHYTAIYPIKVNQQRSVVEALIQDDIHSIGLEAGSKPELLAVMALSRPGGVIVCNGYKDRDYIRLAFAAQAMGQQVYIVIEKPSEWPLILAEAQRTGMNPRLGVRMRLSETAKGQWQNSGGEKGKFGLSTAQLLDFLAQLTQHQALSWLQMLHFHMGSQISDIGDIHRGLQEAARFYQALQQAGTAIQIIDVGGGLGVDYEGSAGSRYFSMNYDMQEYANTIVSVFAEFCRLQQLPEPAIFTESGRAMTAHHALLITEVVDQEFAAEVKQPVTPDAQAPVVLQHLAAAHAAIGLQAASKVFHEAQQAMSQVGSLFLHGLLSVQQRAEAEQWYALICRDLLPLVDSDSDFSPILLEKLQDKYFCNFSIFQSLPDIWGIQQIFPIMPIQGLQHEPTRNVVLQDLTCDSDGQIKQYVAENRLAPSLRLHAINPGESYPLAVFLVGAYQEILGDLHNLFGDTDSIDLHLTQTGYAFRDYERGDTVSELLAYVHYRESELLRACERKLISQALGAERQAEIMQVVKAGLHTSTYLA